MTPDYSSPFQHPLFVSPDVSQCLPSTPNDSNSPSLLPNYTPQTKDPELEFQITSSVRLGSLLQCLDRECALLRHDDGTELFTTGLTLLHHCAQTRANCLVLIAKQAPGVLLRCLVRFERCTPPAPQLHIAA